MPDMKHLRNCVTWGLVAAAILLSPIVVIFLVPVAIGVGLDIFHNGETPLALALCSPVAFVLARRMAPHMHLPAHQAASMARFTRRNRSAGVPARPI
jgi:hypothetical protein